MTYHQEREGRRGPAKRLFARTPITRARRPRRFVIEWLEERCLLASLPPTATTLAATAITSIGATLNGSVNPNGSSTDTYFQYSTDPSLSANVVTTLAGLAGQTGSAEGSGSAARFKDPEGVAVDGAGNVYVADAGNDTIRKITPAGVVTTLAGSPGQAGSADGTGSAARFNGPEGVAVDSAGYVYVADTGNDTIRMITPAGKVTTLAGTPGRPGSADGTGPNALFNEPEGVAVDSLGDIYVADTGNDTIRMMMPGSQYSTMTWGTPGQPGSTNGSSGITALFNRPEGVAVDSAGNVYVADTGNDTIRKITVTPEMAGVVTTLAGTPGQAGSVDGPISAARFDSPEGVAVDSAGNVYVADTGNDTIRMIMPGSMVMTLAGTAGQAGSVDGTGSAALFNDPRGVAVDGADNVYVADTGNDTIRKLSIPSVPAQSGLTGTSPVAVNAALTGLQPNTTYYYEVEATNSAGTTVGTPPLSFTTAAAAPLATTQAASNVTSTAATLSGSVNPEGAATSVDFVYGTDSALQNGTSTTSTQQIPSGTSAVSVNAALTGLQPNTTYYEEVVATNSVGTTDGSILSFTTPAAAAAPLATTQAASNVTATTAALNGSVNPEGAATSVSFIYGTDPTLTTGTTTTTAQPIGNGTSAVGDNVALTGLQPNTTYYEEVVATNSVGTTNGRILSFTTAAAPQPPPPAEIQSETVVFRQTTNRKGEPVGKPTLAGFQFTFNTAMNGATAGNRANYMLGTYVQVIKSVGRKNVRVLQLEPVSFTVSFQSSNLVKLLLTGKQTFSRGGQITLIGTGISSAAGGLLDGNGDGIGGGNAVYNISANAGSISHA